MENLQSYMHSNIAWHGYGNGGDHGDDFLADLVDNAGGGALVMVVQDMVFWLGDFVK